MYRPKSTPRAGRLCVQIRRRYPKDYGSQGDQHNGSDLGASRSVPQASSGLPGSGEGTAAFEVVTRQQGKHAVHVFTYEGNPVMQVGTPARYRRSTAPASRAFASTICTTPGPCVMCRTERRCTSFRGLRAGRRVDGAALRTSSGGSSGRRCRKGRTQDGHKSVTATPSLKTYVTVSPRIDGDFMVARGGIEPPTRGFSVRCSTN